MRRDQAIELAKKMAKKEGRQMTVRNQYGDYNVWFRYTAGREGRVADAGGEAFGVLSCFVHPDGTVEELGSKK
jgi:hypothetical protein